MNFDNQTTNKKSEENMKNLMLALVAACCTTGCELATEIDRRKIPSDGGEAGQEVRQAPIATYRESAVALTNGQQDASNQESAEEIAEAPDAVDFADGFG